jgi:hypothetical protein
VARRVPLVATPSFPPNCESWRSSPPPTLWRPPRMRASFAHCLRVVFVFLLTERVSRSFVVARSRAELGELPVGHVAMDGAAV